MLKMSHIISIAPVFQKLQSQTLPIYLLYKLSKIQEFCEQENVFYRAQLTNILQTYAKKDENGEYIYSDDKTTILIQENKLTECQAKLNDLVSIELHFNGELLELEELNNLELTLNDFNLLKPFIKEKEAQ